MAAIREQLRVAIVYGGQSAEHEISILSARYVLAALDRRRFEPVLIGIDKSGRWLRHSEAGLLNGSTDPKRLSLQTGTSVDPLALAQRTNAVAISAFAKSVESSSHVDVVFPVLHGTRGEDGCIQGLLELANVPYVGAGVLGSAIGMDKDVTKRLLIEAGIPVAKFMAFRKSEFLRRPLAVCRKAACLGMPVFTKPANLGSSVGVRRVTERRQLRDALSHAFEFDDKVLVEQAIVGRELECAVLGGDEPIASGVGEIVVTSADGFYSYDAKYLDADGARLDIPAKVDRATQVRVRRLAVRAFQALECHGLARVDFFLTAQGCLLVNEINTLPGFTQISMYPKLWEHAGMQGQELISRLIDLAMLRSRNRQGHSVA
jgi:D-alanine-D-alanine ligase